MTTTGYSERRPRRRRLGPGAPQRPEGPLRRGRRRHRRLRAEPHPGRRRLELDQPARPTASGATSPAARTSRSCSRQSGIGPDTTIVLYGDNNNWFAAWAYWQLKLYGHKDVADPQRRPQATGWTTACRSRSTCRPARDDELPAARGEPRAARLPRRHPAAARRARVRAGRRPLAGRVQRRGHRASGHDRDGPAGRPHPGCGVDPVGPDRRGGRHVQGRRRRCARTTRPRA